MICIIAAVSANGVIGAGERIPWDIPEDRHYFRKVTTSGVVIMGRRTFESIGRPLPERFNIVVSGTGNFRGRMLRTAGSLEKALKMGEKFLRKRKKGDIFLCGGAEIYRQGLVFADRMYLTELYDEYEGDVLFPENTETFRLTLCEEHPELRLRFCIYDKENNRIPR